MKSYIHFLLFVLLGSTCISQVVTSPPSGTSVVSSSNNPFAIGLSGGITYTHSNSSWPALQNNCYVFAINDTIYQAINGNSPSGGTCSNMSTLAYNSPSSDLSSGLIVYTGTTSYKYQNGSGTFVINNNVQVRATVTISSPISYYPNNTFVAPVTTNFNYNVLIECLAPTDAVYSGGITSNTWVPAKVLYDAMITDPSTSFCINPFEGQYTLHSVTATTSPSSAICEGGTLQLIGGGTGNNLSFAWTGPNNHSDNQPNTTITNVSTGNTGIYTLTVTDDVGCISTTTSSITIHEKPIANAGGNTTICVNSNATVTGASAANGTISWTHNGSGMISNTGSLTPTYTPAPSDAGNTVVLTMTVSSNNTCAPSTAQASYSIIIQGNPVAIDGATTSTCASVSHTITTATAQFGTIQWTHTGSGTLTNATSVNPTYTPGALDDGNTVILIMTVTSNNLCAPGTAQAFHLLNVNALPYAVAGGSATVCEDGSVTVNGAVADFGTISWTHNGSGSLTNINTITPTYEASSSDIGNIVTLTMTVTSTSCAPASASADFTVIVQGLPHATITNSSLICAGSSATVSGVSISNGTFNWTHNGSGTLSNNGTLTPTYNSSPQDGGNTVELSIHVTSNNSCSPAVYTGIYSVNVDNIPVATLPSNVAICGALPYEVNNITYDYGTPSWIHSGAGTLTNQNTGTPTYTPSPSDYGQIVILTLNLTSNNTCAPYVLTKSFNLQIQNPPVAVAGGTTKACQNSVANITGATATYGTIYWTHDGTGVLSDETTLGPVYHPTPADIGVPVTLTLTVTSNNSCAPLTASDYYTVLIDPLPEVTATGVGHMCVNSPYTITDVITNHGNVQWTHDGLGVLSDPTTSTPTYTPHASEEGDTVLFTIQTQSNNSCAPALATGQFPIVIDPAPILTIETLKDTLCPESTYYVTGVVGLNGDLVWTHNGTGTLTGENTLTPQYTAGLADNGSIVSLTCTLSSNNGCAPQSLTGVIEIYVDGDASIPVLSLNSIEHVHCFGDTSGSISLNVSGGTLPYTFEWSNGTTNQNLTDAPAGTHFVHLYDNHGCHLVDTFVITEPSEIVLSLATTPIDCFNRTAGSILVEGSGGIGPYTYNWPELHLTGNAVTGIPQGNHIVLTTDASGCEVSDTITLNATGELQVIASPNSANVNIGTPIHITTIGASNYHWNSSDFLSCDDCANPTATPENTITYIVEGTTPDGCTGRDTVSITVYVDCSNLSVPNTFSPNETGPEVNNTFGLMGALPCVDKYLFLVFNRWGEQVFESQDVKEKWDGTYKGQPQSSGVYYYRMDINLVDGGFIQKSGNITLVR